MERDKAIRPQDHQVLRRPKDGTRVSVPCPEAVYKYNRYMGGVDKGDQLRKYYHVEEAVCLLQQVPHPSSAENTVWFCSACDGHPPLCLTGKGDSTDCYRLWYQNM